MTRWIFKILRPDEFEVAKPLSTYTGSSDDVRDGFIHFSTIKQMPGTANKYFDDVCQIHVLAFDVDLWRDGGLRWEASRGGDLFPHLYGSLDVKKAQKSWSLNRKSGDLFDFAPIEDWVDQND